MMRAMFSAISGLQAHQTMLDVAANDVANVNTIGFKGEMTTFQDALSQQTRGASSPTAGQGGTNAIQVGLGVQLGAVENEMGAGATQQTGNPLDLAIQGDGLFRVAPGSAIGSGSGYQYTRAGNFGLDSSGNLVTQGGDFVVGYAANAGPPVTFPMTTANETKITVPSGGSDVTIGSDGVVSYVDSAGVTQKLAQISMAKFPNEAGLQRVSSNLYEQTNNSGGPTNAVAGDTATGMGTLQAGAVEMSNVDLASEFTTMITAQRGYEANSRVISMADEMLQNLVHIGQ